MLHARQMKIYTKTGDRGTTSLFGGKRVAKSDLRIDAYGNVDELNSMLGTIITESLDVEIKKLLTRIQSELMVLGSDLATPVDVNIIIPRVTGVFVLRLEREIDAWERKLPELKNFILPGGSSVSSKVHWARAIARRSERVIARLAEEEKVNVHALKYINRLSDWLFVLARYINLSDGGTETIWKGRG